MNIFKKIERTRGIAFWLGVCFALFHVYLVSHTVLVILAGNERDWPIYWLIFIYIDFPYSLLAMAIDSIYYTLSVDVIPSYLFNTHEPVYSVYNFIMPLLLYGVGGTIWWFYLPRLVLKLWRKIVKRKALP